MFRIVHKKIRYKLIKMLHSIPLLDNGGSNAFKIKKLQNRLINNKNSIMKRSHFQLSLSQVNYRIRQASSNLCRSCFVLFLIHTTSMTEQSGQSRKLMDCSQEHGVHMNFMMLSTAAYSMCFVKVTCNSPRVVAKQG